MILSLINVISALILIFLCKSIDALKRSKRLFTLNSNRTEFWAKKRKLHHYICKFLKKKISFFPSVNLFLWYFSAKLGILISIPKKTLLQNTLHRVEWHKFLLDAIQFTWPILFWIKTFDTHCSRIWDKRMYIVHLR